ncbi:protein kinase family protein [Streptomyces sp. NPDC087294]|uniref:protein kinase family protein n=1 Tax=Streptomyces sp. NPDC087294 TaxID=3365777 RepID=UPI00382D1941
MDTRPTAHAEASTALSLYSDQELRELLSTATPLGSGIGGRSARLEVSGVPVFVKRVPLTARELLPEHARSTANLYGLPLICQYGVGGPGFGAWRELAAHVMTTNWVLAGGHQGFPLLYHWRVLPDPVPDLPAELADVERAVAYWDGHVAVRGRIEGLRESPASLVLFLEYFPLTLHEWLGQQVRAGDAAIERACQLVERELELGTSFMNARGLLHFDAHFRNVLTDGRRLYFTDFGLALADGFRLSPAESDFFATHRQYDRAYTRSYLVNWLFSGLYDVGRAERFALIRACADGARPPAGPPPGAVETLIRLAPIAATFTDFYIAVQDEDRRTPYPAETIRRQLAYR